VVAGGREPAHWEQYPGHHFLHTIGSLDCCATGGCWKSRTVPLGDGSALDSPDALCSAVTLGGLPRCMDLITSNRVCESIEALSLATIRSETFSRSPSHHSHELTPLSA
jgi:hypothetical protein